MQTQQINLHATIATTTASNSLNGATKHSDVGYTWREIALQNPRPRHDRHFVGITWHNVCSYGGEDLSCYLNKIQPVGLF